MTSPLLGQMFFRAASFMTFYGTIRALNGGDHSPSPKTIFTAGGVTGFVISFIETPIDLIKTKLQIQIFSSRTSPGIKPLYTTFTGCVKHVVNGTWRPCPLSRLEFHSSQKCPCQCDVFPCKRVGETEVRRDGGRSSDAQVSTPKKLLSGAIAGMSYWTLLYPLDAIKGRSMAETYPNRKSWLRIVRNMAFKDFFTRDCTLHCEGYCCMLGDVLYGRCGAEQS